MTTKLENFLDKFNENDWFSVLQSLIPDIHEVDRNAVQIWFRFYPLELFRALQAVENRDELTQKFVMQGNYEIKNERCMEGVVSVE